MLSPNFARCIRADTGLPFAKELSNYLMNPGKKPRPVKSPEIQFLGLNPLFEIFIELPKGTVRCTSISV